MNYDFSHQVILAQGVERSSRNWNELLREWFRRTQNRAMSGLTRWQQDHARLSLLFPFALVLLLIILRFDWIRALLRWLSLSLQLRRSSEVRSNPQLASRLYAELQRLLMHRGFTRAEAQTPFEFARSLTIRPELAPAVREFTQLYSQARFGNLPCDTVRLRALLQEIKSTLKAR